MLKRSDELDPTNAPQFRPETRHPTPNRGDIIVTESAPISPGKYAALPYGTPHPDYDNNGLVLVWQGPIKASNNQIRVIRIYSTVGLDPQDWFNFALEFSGDITDAPIYIRTYTLLRSDYVRLAERSLFTGVFLLKVTAQGSGYTSAPNVVFSGPGSGAAATAIMSPDNSKVIGLELTAEGTGYTTAPTISFTGGGGSGAAATAQVQPPNAYLVKEKMTELQDPRLESLFVKVQRFYEVLPGPWIPFTRYDDHLGPIQGRRRSVLATAAQKASLSATLKRTYEGRDGSAVVSHEIEEGWTTGEGTTDNPAFPITLSDTYTDERGAVDRSTQVVVAAGDEELQEATLTRNAGVVTKTWYEAFDEFHLKKIVEHWVEVVVNDKRVTSEFGGGILDVTERTDEPGAQTPDTGFLVVDSRLKTKSPHEQTKFTEKLSPDSAIPVLELVDGGAGFSAPPAVSFAGGTVVTPAVAVAVLGFGLQSLTVTNGGSGYETPPAIGFINGGGGGAFAVAVLGFGLGGVTILDGGSGYTSAPTVAITGDGTGATGTAIIGKAVASIAITAPGTGWTGVPTVVFAGNGSGATANVVMGNPVLSVAVTAAGTGYATPPTVGFTGDGAGAAATAKLGLVGTPVVTAGGTGYVLNDILTLSGGTSTTAARVRVTAVAAGVITAVAIETAGVYSAIPSSPVSVTGGAGTAATFTPAWGVVAIVVTNGGTHGYTATPTVSLTGGSGTGAAATATVDPATILPSRIDVVDAGQGYTTAPTLSFSGGGGTGLTATATLAASGKVVGVTITAPGSGYTSAVIGFSGGGGSGATADAVIALTGSVIRVDVFTPGSFRTVPTVSFVGGGGSGAIATAVLASTGSVVELDLTTPGLYTVAPTVVFTGAHTLAASAIYHIGSLLWPANRGFNTDPTEGIVVNHIKKVVPEGTPHPGRGNFVDMLTHDRWKSIQIVSAVDLDTLPLPETYWTTHPFHLYPQLLSVEAVWSDIGSKLASAQETSAHVIVSSGSSGGIIVRRTSGFHGIAKAYVTRIWFFGPPPESAVPVPLKILGSSGSVVITSKRSQTQYTNQDNGGTVIGDENSVTVHALDVSDHMVGAFAIVNATHQSPARNANAESAGGSTAAAIAYGQVSTMSVNIPPSSPSSLISGQVILAEARPQKWRFGVWVLELIYVVVP